jgi:hypothetical protein
VMGTTRILVMITMAVSLAACGGEGEPEETASPAADRPSSTAELRIVEPAPGAVVSGDIVPVVLELEGARIVEEVSTDLRPDEGHVHLALDGESLTLLGGLEEDLAELRGEPLPPGQHILEAEFVAADHGFFLPRVIATTTFTVE